MPGATEVPGEEKFKSIRTSSQCHTENVEYHSRCPPRHSEAPHEFEKEKGIHVCCSRRKHSSRDPSQY